MLEGEENITGCSIQARHSYTVEDVVWDQTFAPCVSANEQGGCSIDFSKFHETVTAGAADDWELDYSLA